jgi:phage terminase large subunit-like protein
MSTIKDITSLNCLINKDGKFYSFNWHWIANDESKLLRRNGYDLYKYVESGELIISRSNKAINYREIFEKIEELSEFLNVVVVGHDNHNTIQLAFDIENELGIDCEFVQQGYALSNAIQHLEFLMNENQYNFNNALTKWMFGNVYIQVGVVKGDWQIVKGKSKDAIDGVIAMCNNLHLHTKYRTDSDSLSFKNQLERLRAEQSAKS